MLKLKAVLAKAEKPKPAAFGRLCVETLLIIMKKREKIPAAFGRLCVETLEQVLFGGQITPSRLRAAVC